MIKKIIQETKNLIGSKKDIDALAVKEHARLLVISDSHGHYQTLEEIVKRYGSQCDGLVFCGDGAGDISQLLKLSKSDSDLRACIPPVIALARGNGDPSTYPVDSDLSIFIPNGQIFTVNGRSILLVHGHREAVDFGMENLGLEMQLSDCKLAFYGHTHIAREERSDDYMFVNPGSCARPRGGQPAGFAIATIEKNFVDIAFIKMEMNDRGEKIYSIWTPYY